MCPNLVVRDRIGRVKTLVAPKAGGTTVKSREDRTQQDKLTTTADIIDKLQSMAVQRSKQAQNSRRQRKEQQDKKKAPTTTLTATADPVKSDNLEDGEIPIAVVFDRFEKMRPVLEQIVDVMLADCEEKEGN